MRFASSGLQVLDRFISARRERLRAPYDILQQTDSASTRVLFRSTPFDLAPTYVRFSPVSAVKV